jgi:hypothetical protein
MQHLEKNQQPASFIVSLSWIFCKCRVNLLSTEDDRLPIEIPVNSTG